MVLRGEEGKKKPAPRKAGKGRKKARKKAAKRKKK